MKKENAYEQKRPMMEQLLALGLFHKEGMAAVESMFPQYRAFDEEHKNQPFAQVKEQLLRNVPHVA